MGISCVILNYNDYSTVETLIKAIQDYEILDHIVIVDNCSTDDSYSRLIKLGNTKIKIIRSQCNGGYGYGNNLGIKYVIENYDSEMILICNPDVAFKKELIGKMRDALCQRDDYVLASAIPYDIRGKLQKKYAWKVPTISQCVLASGKILQKFFRFHWYPDNYCFHKDVTEVECVPGSLLLVKTSAMQQCGMYDEDIFLYGEESVLGYKLKNLKLRSIIVNDRFEHLHSVSINKSIRSSVKQRKIMYQSFMIYITKYLQAKKWQRILCKCYFSVVVYENYFDGLIQKVKNLID